MIQEPNTATACTEAVAPARRRSRRTTVAAATAVALLTLATGSARAQIIDRCVGAKTKCVTQLVAKLLGCSAKASKSGTLLNAVCVDKVRAAFLDPVKGCMAKAEQKGPCPTVGDADDLAALVSFFVERITTDVNPSYPAVLGSKCAGAKTTCIAKYATAILKCHAKSNKTGLLDPICVQKAETKLAGPTGCFAKAEQQSDCPVLGNLGPVREAADGQIGGSVCSLDPTAPGCIPPGCPHGVELEVDGTSAATELDLGWTGLDHDTPYSTGLTLSGTVLSCDDPCGRCTFTGPIPNADADAGAIDNRRCLADSSTRCDDDGDCSGGADTCVYFAGAPLSLRNGGAAFCAVQRIVGPTLGTFDAATGEAETALTIDTQFHLGLTIAEPCPRCTDAGAANDGVAGGTCTGGARSGLACDANAVSPYPSYGATSLDCPPDVVIGDPGRTTVRLSTASQSRPLSAASPACGADPSLACHCDTCADAAGKPCATDADCADGVVCGGDRCVGGTNAGAPCASGAECPSGTCGVPGQPTRPSSCVDDTSTGADESICSTTAFGGDPEGACAAGPFTFYCAAPEQHRACVSDAECPLTATCLTEFQRCFVQDPLSGAITASGTVDTPVAGVSTPTLSGLFCAPPTATAFLNAVAGLPGPARLTTRVTMRQLP